MAVIAIAIVARNGVIGDGVDQPFSFAEDWRRFKRVTAGHPIIMGRATFAALDAKLLPGRTTIVVTRSPKSVTFTNVDPQAGTLGFVAGSVTEALAMAQEMDETVYICGGGEIYRQLWDRTDVLDVTEVHADAVGSVTFPAIDDAVWVETSRECRGEFDFVQYRRRADVQAESVTRVRNEG